MTLYLAKLGPESADKSLFSTMCVKYDGKSSILPVWFSRELAEIEVPGFTAESYHIEELDWTEYTELADQHQKLGINLFLHVRRPEAPNPTEDDAS